MGNLYCNWYAMSYLLEWNVIYMNYNWLSTGPVHCPVATQVFGSKWANSRRWFIYLCLFRMIKIRGHDMARMQWSLAHSYSDLGSSLMSSSAKFAVWRICIVRANRKSYRGLVCKRTETVRPSEAEEVTDISTIWSGVNKVWRDSLLPCLFRYFYQSIFH